MPEGKGGQVSVGAICSSPTRRTLVFPVTALNLFMDVFLDLTLEDACSGRLVEAGGFQDVCRIDPFIMATAHNMLFQVGPELELVDGDLHVNHRR